MLLLIIETYIISVVSHQTDERNNREPGTAKPHKPTPIYIDRLKSFECEACLLLVAKSVNPTEMKIKI